MDNNAQVIRIIKEIFGNIPFIKITEYKEHELVGQSKADLLIKYEFNNEIRELIIEVKPNGEPRIVREAVNQLLRFKEIRPNAYLMVAAPYVSQNSAAICTNNNIGYLDFAGNLFIKDDPIYIQKNIDRNPVPEKRELKKLYSPKAERVLRVLLETGKKKWLTEELAVTADVSIGLVAKVKKSLLNKDWLISEYGGFSLIKPFELLDEWSKNYEFSRNQKYLYYSMSPVRETEIKLAAYFNKKHFEYSFTGQSAGVRYAPMVRYRTVKVYIKSLAYLNDLKTDLDIKPVSSGANVQFLLPYDEGVFFGKTQIEKIFVVSHIQVYLDLMVDQARGEEEAVEVLKNGVLNKWQ